jgi:hypothetical protein
MSGKEVRAFPLTNKEVRLVSWPMSGKAVRTFPLTCKVLSCDNDVILFGRVASLQYARSLRGMR